MNFSPEHTELKITPEHIRNQYDDEKLLEWLAIIKTDLCSMDIQIETAKISNNVDKEWLRKLKVKKKFYGALHQEIQTQLSIVKKRYAKKYQNTFVDVCRTNLDAETFQLMKQLTYTRLEQL